MKDIKIIQYKNKFGYTTIQLKINYVNKTFKRGSFTIGADKTCKTMKEFFGTIDELKKVGFKED